MEQPSKRDKSFETAAAFIGGVVMLLLAPLIPQLLDQYRARGELWAIVDGPVYFRDRAAYSVEVQNRGRVIERDVEIRVPTTAATRVEFEVDPFDFSQRPAPAVRLEGDHSVASLGDLNPGETQRISVLVAWEARDSDEPAERFRNIPHVLPRVTAGAKTTEQQGWRQRAYQAERRAEWYRSALDLMLAALVLLILLLIREPVKPPPPGPPPRKPRVRPYP